eukprot:11070681-Lingulodinium_polyedra.AAC.1
MVGAVVCAGLKGYGPGAVGQIAFDPGAGSGSAQPRQGTDFDGPLDLGGSPPGGLFEERDDEDPRPPTRH